jgi:hypothetical protein
MDICGRVRRGGLVVPEQRGTRAHPRVAAFAAPQQQPSSQRQQPIKQPPLEESASADLARGAAKIGIKAVAFAGGALADLVSKSAAGVVDLAISAAAARQQQPQQQPQEAAPSSAAPNHTTIHHQRQPPQPATDTAELLLAQQLQSLLRRLEDLNADLQHIGPDLRTAGWRAPRSSELGRRAAGLAEVAAELGAAAAQLAAALPAGATGAGSSSGSNSSRAEGRLVVEAVQEYAAAVARHLEIAVAPPSAETAPDHLITRLRQHLGGSGGSAKPTASSSTVSSSGGADDFSAASHAVYNGAIFPIHRDADAAGAAPVILAPGRLQIAAVPKSKRRLLQRTKPGESSAAEAAMLGRIPGVKVVGPVKIGLAAGERADATPAVKGGARKHVVLERELVAVFEGLLGQRVAVPCLMNGLVEDG